MEHGGALSDLVSALDAERFVGRDAEIALVLDALDRRSPTRIVHVHGPAGVGKSATLRELARRAEARGARVHAVDGRLVVPVPDAVDAALELDADADSPDGPAGPILVLIDEADALSPLRLELRRAVAQLPSSAVTVIAGRVAPDRTWFEEGLDRVSSTLVLRPLPPEACREVLRRAGMAPEEIEPIAIWSKGYPLALGLAASLGSAEPGEAVRRVHEGAPGDRLDDLLLERLGSAELEGVDPDVLDVAAIAPAIDARMLADVLPGRPTRASLAALRACRLAEAIGPRFTLHALARSTIAARLRATDPERHRTHVLRIADHLRARGALDGARVLPEMASLVESPQVRVGFGPSTTHYADRPRPDDLGVLADHLAAAAPGWFARLARWLGEAPEHVVAIRRVDGVLASVGVSFTVANVPPWALESVEVGPAVERARALGHSDETIFLQDVVVIEGADDPMAVAEIHRIGNATALARSGFASPRYAYVTSAREEMPELGALGYVEDAALRRGDDERELVTLVCDFGPDGMVGRCYDLIRAEQAAEPMPGATAGAWLAEALRCFHDDEALAAVARRPAPVARDDVRAAISLAFGTSAVDADLRRALERTYLDLDGGHSTAQRELFMSRSSYYRFLQRARHQLVERGTGERGAVTP